MKRIFVYGSGGFAREVVWLIEEINKKKKTWKIEGFLDDDSTKWGSIINDYEILGNFEHLKGEDEPVYVVIAIGNPFIKEKIKNKLNNIKNVFFATLIHPNVLMSKHVNIGIGSIICAGSIITTNVKIGEHVIINLDTTIGHDATINDYSTILPSVNISGNVMIGKKVSVGTGSAIIQNIKIGDNTVVGAGAVVVKNIPANCTAVGVPAKPLN